LYTNIMVGELGSTFTPEAQAKKKNPPPVTASAPAAPAAGQLPVQPQLPLQPVAPMQPAQPAVQPVQPVPPVQPVQPMQPAQPAQPGQPVPPLYGAPGLPTAQPLLPAAPVALQPGLPALGAAPAPAGSFCCFYSPDPNDYCGKCTSKQTSGWMTDAQHCQQGNGRMCGATRLFDVGQGTDVAAAIEGAQKQVPTLPMALAWSLSMIMLVMLGVVSVARYRRAGQMSAAAADGTFGQLIQENQAETEQTDGV